MADKKYQVLFSGEIKPGADIESVKNNLAQVFKVDKGKVESLFSGKQRVVKKNATREVCEKTKRVFEAAGAVVDVVPQGGTEPAPPPIDPGPDPQADTEPAAAEPVDETSPPAPDTVVENAPVDQTPSGNVNKVALLLLTFFLGGVGIHKFYLSKVFQGVLYIVFCWTAIPGLLAMVEFFVYLFTSEEKLNSKYKAGSTPLVIIMAVFGPLFFLVALGIIFAIAIPLILATHQGDIITSAMQLMSGLPAMTETANAAPADDAVSCSGKIKGLDFSVKHARLENGVLYLRQGEGFIDDREMIVFMFRKDNDLSNQCILASAGNEQFSDPHIHLRWKAGQENTPQSDVTMKGYDLMLEFGEGTGNTLPGRIDLNIPGEQETRLAGTFTALLTD